jgi:hypothetical protein
MRAIFTIQNGLKRFLKRAVATPTNRFAVKTPLPQNASANKN